MVTVVLVVMVVMVVLLVMVVMVVMVVIVVLVVTVVTVVRRGTCLGYYSQFIQTCSILLTAWSKGLGRRNV